MNNASAPNVHGPREQKIQASESSSQQSNRSRKTEKRQHRGQQDDARNTAVVGAKTLDPASS